MTKLGTSIWCGSQHGQCGWTFLSINTYVFFHYVDVIRVVLLYESDYRPVRAVL